MDKVITNEDNDSILLFLAGRSRLPWSQLRLVLSRLRLRLPGTISVATVRIPSGATMISSGTAGRRPTNLRQPLASRTNFVWTVKVIQEHMYWCYPSTFAVCQVRQFSGTGFCLSMNLLRRGHTYRTHTLGVWRKGRKNLLALLVYLLMIFFFRKEIFLSVELLEAFVAVCGNAGLFPEQSIHILFQLILCEIRRAAR